MRPKTDNSCPKIRFGRTEVGDFAFCADDAYKFGPGSPNGTLGWYPGRG